MYVCSYICVHGRSQWLRGLRRRSAAARLLRLWFRIPPGAWMFICCECCVLSGRGLCDELITRPEESYRLWCVVVCDIETSWMRRPWPTGGGAVAPKKKKICMSLCTCTLVAGEVDHEDESISYNPPPRKRNSLCAHHIKFLCKHILSISCKCKYVLVLQLQAARKPD